jgi:hypothetical protein
VQAELEEERQEREATVEKVYATLHVLDTRTATWSTLPPAPFKPRAGHSCTAVGPVLYIYGGAAQEDKLGQRAVFDEWLTYDTEARTWRRLTVSTPPGPFRGRVWHAATRVGGSIYLTGGVSLEVADLAAVDELRLADHAFVRKRTAVLEGSALPRARYGHAAVLTQCVRAPCPPPCADCPQCRRGGDWRRVGRTLLVGRVGHDAVRDSRCTRPAGDGCIWFARQRARCRRIRPRSSVCSGRPQTQSTDLARINSSFFVCQVKTRVPDRRVAPLFE